MRSAALAQVDWLTADFPTVSYRSIRATQPNPYRGAGLERAPAERAVVVVGCLKATGHWPAEIGQELDGAVVFRPIVRDAQPATAASAGRLDQDLVAGFGDVDGYEGAARWISYGLILVEPSPE